MNLSSLASVKFGDRESLGEFLFENELEHRLFQNVFMDQGIRVPIFPIQDVDTTNLDDWLMAHQVEHQAFASLLGLENPFNLLDTDWNVENDFYDWLNQHYDIHTQIIAALGL
jgi:hypothetical protein